MKRNSFIGFWVTLAVTSALICGPASAQSNPAGQLHKKEPFRRSAPQPQQAKKPTKAKRATSASKSLQQLERRNSAVQAKSGKTARTNRRRAKQKSGHQTWHGNGYGHQYPPTYPGRNANLPQPGVDYTPSYGYGYGYNNNGYGYGYNSNYYRRGNNNRYRPGPRANQGYTPNGRSRR